MSDPECPRGHVWVTRWGAKVSIVSVCKNCGADQPVFEFPYNDPINVEKRRLADLVLDDARQPVTERKQPK